MEILKNNEEIVGLLNTKIFWKCFIIESGMMVAEDYPEASQKDIVQRALQRKKPFKADGSTGYQILFLE